MHCEGKLKLRLHNASYCLRQVVTKAGLTVVWYLLQVKFFTFSITGLEDAYCFCSVSYYCIIIIIILFLLSFRGPWTCPRQISGTFFTWTEFHETWWSYRYMFLVGPKVFSLSYFEGFKGGVGVTIESYGKVEISYINVDNF
jgi:hypothetical protein